MRDYQECHNVLKSLDLDSIVELRGASTPVGILIHDGRVLQIKRSHNYYWIVNGEVPLDKAQKLYSTEWRRRDIRVAGHCGSPAPESPWTKTILSDGRELIPALHRADFERFGSFIGDYKDKYAFDDEDLGHLTQRTFVDTYHIDNDEALRHFVAEMRAK